MASSGIFTLLTNEGKADRLIMATSLLTERLTNIFNANVQAGAEDPTPTLADIEATHILFVSPSYQPFAAMASEYIKARSQSGTAQLGGEVQFSIPQAGDFFNDMVLHIILDHVSASALLTPVQSPILAPVAGVFPAQEHDAAGGVATGYFYNLVNANGDVVVAGNPLGNVASVYQNLIRYNEWPGLSIVRKCSFDVNNSPIDSYTNNASVMLQKFTIPSNKMTAFKRLNGQEVPISGYTGPRLSQVLDADSANTPATIRVDTQNHGNALYTVAGTAFTTVAATAYDYVRREKTYLNGPQTPKYIQPPLELWHKVKMFFSEDVRLSIASVCIPFGQRFITFTLGNVNDVVSEYCNLYLETIFENVADGYRTKTYTPIFQKGADPTITITLAELYIDNIYVSPDVHDIFLHRIQFTLIRVYREQTNNLKNANDSVLLQNLKYPIEYMFIGLQPSWNTTNVTAVGSTYAGNLNKWRDWHRMCRILDGKYNDNVHRADLMSTLIVPGPATGVPCGGSIINPVVVDEFPYPLPTIDTMKLESHGTTIFDYYPDSFYNAYLPYVRGRDTIVSPEDPGALWVNFSFHPGIYQPSGHFNFSRARENYIYYTSRYVSANTTCNLIVVAVAINFLLISDGNATLRYTT